MVDTKESLKARMNLQVMCVCVCVCVCFKSVRVCVFQKCACVRSQIKIE